MPEYMEHFVQCNFVGRLVKIWRNSRTHGMRLFTCVNLFNSFDWPVAIVQSGQGNDPCHYKMLKMCSALRRLHFTNLFKQHILCCDTSALQSSLGLFDTHISEFTLPNPDVRWLWLSPSFNKPTKMNGLDDVLAVRRIYKNDSKSANCT